MEGADVRPEHGVAEDAATGSAAGPLAALLISRGLAAADDELRVSQGAEIGRPSTLLVRTKSSAEGLAGIAVGGGVIAIGHGALEL